MCSPRNEITECFDMITFNVSPSHPDEVSKAVPPILHRRNPAIAKPGFYSRLRGRLQPKEPQTSCLPKHRTLHADLFGLASKDGKASRPALVLSHEGIWQRNEAEQLILAAAAGMLAAPSSSSVSAAGCFWKTPTKQAGGRQFHL